MENKTMSADCSIDLCVWCCDEATYNKFYDWFSVAYTGELQLCPARDNTNIQSAIWHSFEDDRDIDSHWTFVLEAYLNHAPEYDDIVAMTDALAAAGSIYGFNLSYTDLYHKAHGSWSVHWNRMSHRYLQKVCWPKIADCAHCHNASAMCNSDLTGCDDCIKAIDDELDHNTMIQYIPYKNDKLKPGEGEMDPDNLDRPKLDVTKEELKQIYDAIENISCINDDVVSKLGKAPEMLKQVVHLADCLMAIWHGEAGNELSEIDEVSDSIQEVNSATCDLADAMRNIGAELIND